MWLFYIGIICVSRCFNAFFKGIRCWFDDVGSLRNFEAWASNRFGHVSASAGQARRAVSLRKRSKFHRIGGMTLVSESQVKFPKLSMKIRLKPKDFPWKSEKSSDEFGEPFKKPMTIHISMIWYIYIYIGDYIWLFGVCSGVCIYIYIIYIYIWIINTY